MQLFSEENIKIAESSLNIEDAYKNKRNVSVKIEAAHAGVMNGNYLFYLPQALQYGSESLNQFPKPLQKKHYSKTLGYIYNSEYIETNTKSPHYKKIINSKDSKELINNVKTYIKTKDYESNRLGFGVLVAKAKLYNQEKILDLKSNDTGTVSVAGDAGIAYCSICGKHVAICGHKLGTRYQNEVCFGIVADNFEVDHISFETIPANWETNSLIIADSQLMGNIELIEEGQSMKISLSELREKLGNIDSVLTELNLIEYTEQYKTDIASALKSQFLLSADSLIPFNTPLTIYIANKLIESLEDSEDKHVLIELFGTTYSDIFDGKTEEEVKNILTNTVKEEPKTDPVIDPVVPATSTLSVEDSNRLVLAISDSLAASFDNSFQNVLVQLKELFTKESEVKANKLLEDQIVAYKEDLTSADVLREQITSDLKESILNQIILLKNIDITSDYFLKLKERSIQELKMTLEDHIQLTKSTPVPTTKEEPVVDPLQVKDSLVIDPVSKTTAVSTMDNPDNEPSSLEIEDSDKIVTEIVSKISEKLNKPVFTSLYKKTVLEHGSKVAKKLHAALKAENKI